MLRRVQTEKLLLPVLFLALLGYFAVRACTVPITHDEMATALYYAPMPVWDIVRYADPVPNNHILHTLLLKLTEALFGTTQLTVRLPNLLGFAVYFWSAAAISCFLKQQWLRWSLLALLLLNPYLDDFFSLARGYALSLDLLLLSCAYALRWLQSRKTLHLFGASLWAVLSVYSNFSAMYFCLSLFAAAVLLLLVSRNDFAGGRQLSVLLVCLVLLAVLCVVPIRKMTATNQLQYWGSKGIYEETLRSLSYMSLYGKAYTGSSDHTVLALNILVIVGLLAMIAGFVLRLKRHKAEALRAPASLFLFLLGGSIVLAVLAQLLAGTPYPSTRTALSYYPLFCLAFVFFLDTLRFRHRWIIPVAGASITLALVLHFLNTLNLWKAHEWWYDADNKKVLHYLEEKHRRSGSVAPFTFGCSWWFHPSLTFYIRTQHIRYITQPVYSKTPDLHQQPLYYYAAQEERDSLLHDYVPVLSFNNGERTLFRHK